MAVSELEVVITAVNEAKAAIDETITGLTQVKEELDAIGQMENADQAKEALDRLAQSARNSSEEVEELGNQTNHLRDFLIGLARGVATAVAGLFTLAAAAQAVRAGLQQAAENQQLNTTLAAIGTQAGITSAQLEVQVTALEDLGVAGSAARDSLIRLLQSEVELSEATRLATAAQSLALIAGTSTSDMLQRLVFSVTTLNTRMLRLQGIFISQEQANQRFAQTNGLAADSLTPVQQRMALINAIMEQAAKSTGLAATSLGNFNAKLADQGRQVDDTAQSFGEIFLPAATEVLRIVSALIQELRVSIDSFRNTTDITATLERATRLAGQAFQFMIDVLGPVVELVLRAASAFAELATKILETHAGLGLLIALLFRVFPVLSVLAAAVFALNTVFDILGVSVGDIVTGIITAFRRAGLVLVEIAMSILDGFQLLSIGVQGAWNDMLEAMGLRTKEQAAQIRATLVQERNNILSLRDSRHAVFLDSEREIAEANKVRKRLGEVIREIENAERDAVAARQANDEAGAASAIQRRNELLKERNELQKNLAVLEQRTKATQKNDEADRNRAENEARKRAEDLRKALRELLGGTRQRVQEGVDTVENVTAEGRQAILNLDIVMQDFLRKTPQQAVAAFSTVRQAIIGAMGQAKTVEDFTLLIARLNDHAETMGEKFAALAREAAFRQQRLALQQMNQEMSGFLDAVKQIQGIQANMADLLAKGLDHEVALAKVEAEILDNKRQQYALDLRSTGLKQVSALEKFLQEQTLIRESFRQQEEQAKQRFTDEQSRSAALRALKAQEVSELQQSAKTYYDSLRELQSQYLQQFRAASLEVINITRQQTQARISADNQIRDIQRQGLSEAQRTEDIRAELFQRREALAKAVSKGDKEAADAEIQRIRTLASTLASANTGKPEQNRQDAIAFLQAAKEGEQAILEQQKVIAAQAAVNAKAGMQSIADQITRAEDFIKRLTDQQVGLIKIQIDQTSLNQAVALIKSAFENITVVIKTITQPVDATTQSNADGGKIGGWSPHSMADNLLSWVTAGEFVQPVRAVRHYGENFMEAIRTLRFPRFASGGMIGPSPAAAGAGEGIPTDTTRLELNINGEEAGSVFGPRDTVEKLTRALKQVAKV